MAPVSYTHLDVYKRQKQNKYKTPIKSLITPLIVVVKQFVISNTVSTTNQMKIVHTQ